MPRYIFERKLRLLNRELILMASECETLIAQANRVVLKGEIELSDTMVDEYQALLEKERSVAYMCQTLFVSQQPVASDCGFIITAMKMSLDLKAIGEYALHIVDSMEDRWAWNSSLDLNNLAIVAVHLVTKSIDSFVQEDVDLARRVVQSREQVDADFNRIKKSLIEQWKEDEMAEEQVIAKVLIANDFCHIAHHANNIGQWVVDKLRKDEEE